MPMGAYNEMFSQQKGCCAICKKHQSELKKSLHVDHCHATGKVRELLCQECNHLLGNSQDDMKILLAAIAYLGRHSDV